MKRPNKTKADFLDRWGSESTEGFLKGLKDALNDLQNWRFAMRALTAIACLLLCAAPAHAGFFGNEIRVDWRRPDFDIIQESWSFFPDESIELPYGAIPDAEAQLDIADESILFEVNCHCTWSPDGTFNGFWFQDLNDTMPAIVGFSLERSKGLMNLERSDIDFTENEIWGDFRGITSDDDKGWWFRINVEFIPAPGGLALFGLAAGITRCRRRRS